MTDKTVTTKINAGIVLTEPVGGIRFGTDALLLADFSLKGTKKGRIADLGTGSGVVPLLLLTAGSRADFVGVEISKKYADIAGQNSDANGFSSRFSVVCSDVAEVDRFCSKGTLDAVITNPPYMKADCGKKNDDSDMSRARREETGGIDSFCRSAGAALKSGGRFFAVYRPDRTAQLICSMRNAGIEPKRLRAVVASSGMRPSLILCEGKKDAAEGMVFEKELAIYSDSTHSEFSDEMKQIYSRFSEDKRAT